MTRALLADATARLSSAGIDSARVDAELLLAARLGVARAQLITHAAVPASVARSFGDDIARRVARVPLQHIIGTAPFRHLELAVGPGVFIPRPETELLVDAVAPHLRTVAHPRVVDLCSGSGALALALADELVDARVTAVERDAGALRWLERNVVGIDVGRSEVRILAGDIADTELMSALYRHADAVVSNPPYVPSTTDVAPEVLADPGDAVFAGPDGLGLMSTVVRQAALLLKPGGIVAVEHDDTHGDAVLAMLGANGSFVDIADHRDLTGRPRFATATRADVA